MRNRHLTLDQRFIAGLLFDDFAFKFQRLHVVSEVIKVDRCGLLSKKLNALYANLRVSRFGSSRWRGILRAVLPEAVDETFLLWLVLLKYDNFFETYEFFLET